jgi:hypothetical protein
MSDIFKPIEASVDNLTAEIKSLQGDLDSKEPTALEKFSQAADALTGIQSDMAFFRDKLDELEAARSKSLGVVLLATGSVVYLNSSDRLFVTLGALIAVAGVACLV